MRRIIRAVGGCGLVVILAVGGLSPAAAALQGDAAQWDTTGLPAGQAHVCSTQRALGFARCHAIIRTDIAPNATAPAGGYGPADLQSAYNLAAAAASAGGTQTLVDVLWGDDPNMQRDLSAYRAHFGLPALLPGQFKKVDEHGGTSYPRGDTNGGVEYSLDVDMFSAICPNCNIIVVEAVESATGSVSNADLNTAENTAAALGATEISNSWGGSESPATAHDQAFNHPGIAITASSGDSGYASGPQFPATSPYVTAVGGTNLARAGNARGWTESAWSCSTRLSCSRFGTGGTGSGCSRYESKPAWQTDAACAQRTYSDVSAVADPATGLAVYDTYGQGGWLVVGGTSASAPIIAGVYALAGNVTAVTYGSYPYSHTSNLNDVTTGRNGNCGTSVCTAGPGYDGPTGLGTPNGVGAF